MNSLSHATHGDTAKLSARFWVKVGNKSAECWEWAGCTDDDGYGRFRVGSRPHMAHRVSFELSGGSIPDGMKVDHTCHNPPCVNPRHLRLATLKQNNENHSGATARSASGVRGVSWDKARNRWAAYVQHNGRSIFVGRFDSIEEAAAAVKAARNKHHTHNDLDRI